jgi:protein ImuB
MQSTQLQWAALSLPRLPLESFLRSSSTAEPWAVAEDRHVVDCNAAAFALGVRPRMARAAASALAPRLRLGERDAVAERAALEGFASWAARFTPNVSIVTGTAGTEGVLLEVSGSLKLFGSTGDIAAGLARGALEMGYTACPGVAPTAHGAWLLARGGSPSPCPTLGELARRLQPLPVEVLDCDSRTIATLESVGVRTLGEILALARAGVAKRFGQALRDEIDRALGVNADPRKFFAPPEQFRAGLELPYEVRESEALLFALRRLIVQLGGYLAARDGGVLRLRIGLIHKEGRTDVEIGLARPSRDPEHLILLARERFSSLVLKDPVRRIALAADDIFALDHGNLDLLDDTLKRPGDWRALLERLRARLGNHAVSGIAVEPAHRPEAAWRATEPGERGDSPESGTRPLWLLPHPKRLEEIGSAPHCEGPLVLLAGPERIESGWWDGRDVARDYFVARAKTESLLWIYRERGVEHGHWYLHGIFG